MKSIHRLFTVQNISALRLFLVLVSFSLNDSARSAAPTTSFCSWDISGIIGDERCVRGCAWSSARTAPERRRRRRRRKRRRRWRRRGSRIPNQLPSSRFPMTSFHPSSGSRAAAQISSSPVTPPTHPLHVPQVHGHNGREPPLSGFWLPDVHSPTHPHHHLLTPRVPRRDFTGIKWSEPQYDWSPPELTAGCKLETQPAHHTSNQPQLEITR